MRNPKQWLLADASSPESLRGTSMHGTTEGNRLLTFDGARRTRPTQECLDHSGMATIAFPDRHFSNSPDKIAVVNLSHKADSWPARGFFLESTTRVRTTLA